MVSGNCGSDVWERTAAISCESAETNKRVRVHLHYARQLPGKIRITGFESFFSQDLDQVFPKHCPQYVVAACGVEIRPIVYGCHFLIAELLPSRQHTAGNAYIRGETGAEDKIPDPAQSCGGGDGTESYDLVLLRNWSRLLEVCRDGKPN